MLSGGGGWLGSLRIWDIQGSSHGQPLTARSEPLTGHKGGVLAIALGELDGQLTALTGAGDGTLRFGISRSAPPRATAAANLSNATPTRHERSRLGI